MLVRNKSNYEGLDPADVDRLQAPPAPHHYPELDIRSPRPGAGLDRHGYIQVIADPGNGRDQVLMKTLYRYDVVSQSFGITLFTNCYSVIIFNDQEGNRSHRFTLYAVYPRT